ncbi:MAG TPA: SBBP repeat-containing protein [Blastocatellia bacterium]|nr:SBBP repeat-containing protein [Blastocatellia bacterium]
MKSAGNTIRLAISIALILNGLFSLDRATNTPHQPRSLFISPNLHTTSVTDERNRARVREAYGKLPLRFEANAGQTDSQVKFLSHGSGYTLFLTSAEAVLALRNSRSKADAESKSLIRMKFSGAVPVPQLEGAEALPGRSNYLIGNDPSKWRQNVASYEKVRYRNVYPGIDLIYYGNQRQLEYDFVVAAGADPNVIRLDFDGIRQIRVDDSGDLILNTDEAEVRQHKAVVYQEVNGRRQEIASQYALAKNGEVSFKIGQYDRSLPLVIDPVLSYATYLGSGDNENAEGIAVDAAGNAYVTGETYSLDFPTKNPLQAENAGARSAFVTKLNPEGSDLVFSTYLGGDGGSSGTDITVDEEGNVYVIGSTSSTNFPTVNPLQPGLAGGGDLFVAKLKGDGSALIFSTYLGGSGSEYNGSLKVDREGDISMTGITTSTNFPTVNAFQPVHADSIPSPCIIPIPFCIRFPYGGDEDAFVVKLKGDGSALVFSTYLGGSRGDDGQDLAIDRYGNIYVTGVTGSRNFPTVDPLQAANAGNDDSNSFYDAFVAKFNSNGALVYSTYFGGGANDFGRAISLDEAGNIYLLGETRSFNFPTVNPLKSKLSGGADFYVAKLDQIGSAILYSTYLGGSNYEEARDLKVDAQGNVYLTGYTDSTDFPTVNAIQSVQSPGGHCQLFTPDSVYTPSDIVVAKLDAWGASLVYSTYLGGNCFERGASIAIDRFGSVYVTGQTSSPNFPVTPGAFQTVYSPRFNFAYNEAFIIKIGD